MIDASIPHETSLRNFSCHVRVRNLAYVPGDIQFDFQTKKDAQESRTFA
jgi:hypothetical protein